MLVLSCGISILLCALSIDSDQGTKQHAYGLTVLNSHNQAVLRPECPAYKMIIHLLFPVLDTEICILVHHVCQGLLAIWLVLYTY